MALARTRARHHRTLASANATLAFNINPFAPFFPFASGPELEFDGNHSAPDGDLVSPRRNHQNGSGQMRLSGNNTTPVPASSTTHAYSGRHPSRKAPSWSNSGTLAGSGTVGRISMNGGVVAR